jgi:NADPH-dependent curcumin reductase
MSISTQRRNRFVCLAEYPDGMVESDIFDIVETPVRDLGDGEVAIAVRFTTVDPAMRIYMDPNSIIGGNENLEGTFVRKGDIIRAWIVGEVVASRSDRFPVGSFARDIVGNGGIQEYTVLHEDEIVSVDPDQAPLQAHVNVLGMPGLTAYRGIVDVARPKPGETVVVSAAAGGVGSIAGQIAKALGCRVIGIAGGAEKCRHVVENLGFDGCIDYKTGDLGAALDEQCPNRIDVYFDNVGGPMLDTCIPRIASRGRVIGCGAIATYNGEIEPLRNYTTLLAPQARWECFSYYDFAPDHEGIRRATDQLARWIASGTIRQQEHVFKGIESFGTAIRAMYQGETTGKVILEV